MRTIRHRQRRDALALLIIGALAASLLATSLLATSLLAASLLATPADALANTLCTNVSLTEADGGPALAAAVDAADSCAGAQTISLEPGTYVIRTSLLVDDELSVVGTDASSPSVIDYQPLGNSQTLRVFFVNDTVASFTASNLAVPGDERTGFGYFKSAVTNFNNIHYSGGNHECSSSTPRGITLDGSTATITDSLITDANCVGAMGIQGASITIIGSEITGTNGTAVDVRDGELTIKSSTLHDNTTRGVNTFKSPATIMTSEIYGNGSHGIESRPLLTVSDSFIGVKSDGTPDGNGGSGIFAPFADLTVTRTVIAHNGEGVYAGALSEFPSAFSDSTIRDNTSVGLKISRYNPATSLSNTDVINNSPDCNLGEGTALIDLENSTDSDETCFPVFLCRERVVTVNLNDPIPGTPTDGDDVILGTDGPDEINAGDGNDYICGGEGDDTISGGPGDDVIFGDEGDDVINGEEGDDKLFGRQGHDTIDGGPGDDTIHGNKGNDVLTGDLGDDRIFGYAHNDMIDGGPGHDRLHGNFGDDTVIGGEGDDKIFGYGDQDTLAGGPGDDFMIGNFGNDEMSGGAGDDILFGADGDDIVYGDSGNDELFGNSLNDVLNGGSGQDTLDGGIGTDTCDGGPDADTAVRCETELGVP